MKKINFKDLKSFGAISSGFDLTTLKLKPEEDAYVVPFTNEGTEVEVHYSNNAHYSSIIKCIGEGCPMCATGFKIITIVLLPVYNILSGQVEILYCTSNESPGSLLPQLFFVLSRLDDNNHTILHISRLDKFRYKLNLEGSLEPEDDGAIQIAAFLEKVGSKEWDITSVIQSYSSEEMMNIQRVRSIMRMKKA